MKFDVIIIGAGAAGLMAMHKLLKEGYRVCMLEASAVAGGRIATLTPKRFTTPLETGAEFIHGNLPLTLQLLDEAVIAYHEVEGEMFSVQDGNWNNDDHNEYWSEFMAKLGKLRTDMTILEFLNKHFGDPKYKSLRKDVQRFAEGFNLADISRAAILAIKDEWKDIDKKQFRIEGGYGRLISYLLDSCLQFDPLIYYNTFVNKIEHTTTSVTVHTADGKKFEADKLIITVSAGVLQSGNMKFYPELKEHSIAIHNLGFGTVIKFLLQFKTSFWQHSKDNIGFILSNEEVPTWWTSLPEQNNLLTGWMGGTKAAEKTFWKDDDLLRIAIGSLASIFRLPSSQLSDLLERYMIVNWQNNPNVRGGYSYNTLSTDDAKQLLATPVNKVIYFAGEAVNQGKSQGTVESALESGRDVATLLIKQHQ